MREDFFHHHDDIIFHGIPGNIRGFTFREARLLGDVNDKILKLKERLNSYYIDGLNESQHPFTTAILTCIGIEVLGQVFIGYDHQGKTIENNTIQIYDMLDAKMHSSLSDTFKNNYFKNRGWYSPPFPNDLNSYSRVLRKGLRNAFSHTYRSLGVYLGGSPEELINIDEMGGFIIINPWVFRTRFIENYNNCFDKALNNENQNYRINALKYFELLVR